MSILIVALCGIMVLRSSLIGICILMALECSFIIPAEYITASFGVIGCSASTVIILILLVTTAHRYKNQILTNFDARILFGLMMWLGFSAGVAYLLEQSSINDFFAVIFQASIFYVLPLTVTTLSSSERIKLARFSISLAVVVALIHLYTLWSLNSNFIANFYYVPEEINNSLSIISNNISSGEGVFFIPRGSAFIMLTTTFLLGCLIFKTYKNIYGFSSIVVSLGICLICSITFAQRAFILVIISIVFLSIGISYKKQGLVKSFVGVLFLLLTGYIAISTAATKTNFTTVMANRLTDAFKSKNLDPGKARLAANIDAIDHLKESPVWGIGSIVTGGIGPKPSISQDAHTILRIGLMGGLTAMFLISIWMANLLIRFVKLSKRKAPSNMTLCLPAFCAFLCGTLLMLMNTVPILIYSMNVIPYAIYIGLFMSGYKATMNYNCLISNSND